MPTTAPPPAGTLPDLNDTRIAFRQYTDRGLLRAYWLFRIMGIPWLNAAGKGLTQAAIALRLPIKGAVKATIFKHFCGGETIEESLRTARKLGDGGLGTILDYSVEGQDDEASMEHSCEEVLRTIEAAKEHPHIPFSVFKPTGIVPVRLFEMASRGDALEGDDARAWSLAQERVDRICRRAYEAGIPLLIDAEDSWYQPAIDDLVMRMMERYNRERAIVFNTIQLYRHDRLAFLEAAYAAAERGGYHLGMKLVRGAYMEKERERAERMGYPSPIQPDKASTDRDYDDALRFCIAHIGRMAVMAGTHNEESSLLLARLMEEHGIARNDRRVWFAQLLGMSDNISYNMADAGYNVAKYVPYGPVRAVLPYLIRRAEENTSVAGQMGRELRMISAERRRRKRG